MHIIDFAPDLEAGSHRIENTAVFQTLSPLEGFRGYRLAASAVYLMQQCGKPPGEICFSRDIYWPLALGAHIPYRLVYGNLRTFLSAVSSRLPDVLTVIMGASCPKPPSPQSFLIALYRRMEEGQPYI